MNETQVLWERIRDKVKETGFSGVLSARFDGSPFEGAFGYRDRANELRNQITTRFGIASGTKGFTAVGVARLIEDGKLEFDTPAQTIIGGRIENLHPSITVRHLLGHTSGIGDYLDEESNPNVNERILSIPVQDLESTFDYLPLIEGLPQKFEPGERFSYSNAGYILLAMIIETVALQPFHSFIETQVFLRAGMNRSGFFRSDGLPPDTALGYLGIDASARTNVFHLPVRGNGDGGAYVPVADMNLFGTALLEGGLLQEQSVSELLRPRCFVERERVSYGYGFWIDQPNESVFLEGYDAGVSFRSAARRGGNGGYTVVSNISSGAWPVVALLRDWLHRASG